jgi:2-polyprenyl-3-methyl-5-hydroxy-6-metoxy-1,4-benzoquinol methylase
VTSAPTPDRLKGGGYYGNDRSDLVGALPRPIGRVLDVGCGAGAVGRGLRVAGAEWVAGIELEPTAAAAAAEHYDQVRVGTVESQLDEVHGPFDTICAYDVLEHLADPYDVLRRLRAITRPGGHLDVSVPNARHFSLVRDLVLRGTFGYTEWGHRDNTHLRWFTRRDIVAAVADAGWTVEGTSHPALHRAAALDRWTRGHSTEFLVGQWYVRARNPG